MVRIVLFPIALGPTGCDQARRTFTDPEEGTNPMDLIWMLAVVFFVLWMLGFLAFHITTGFIHLLLVVAVCAVVFRLVSGRRTA